jgi:membrane-associated phospholipid phosphatase
VAVSASRTVLRRHYPSDVLAGAALGLLVGSLVIAWLAPRRMPADRPWLRPALIAIVVGGVAYMSLGPKNMRRCIRALGGPAALVVGVRCAQLARRRNRAASDG